MNEAEDFAIRIGMVNLADKSWDYVRDTTWPNIKKATITNVDKYNQTVAGAGTEAKLIDLAVLEIGQRILLLK
uniref:Uncharacterized protein n=1 Tax=Romanomermis culicivorax TaxID=13658 RepID=A0A915KXH9_ROMCU